MDDMGDFILAEVASEAFFVFGYGGISFFGSLGESFNQLGRNTFDFESRTSLARSITQLLKPVDQFVAIDLSAVMNGVEHAGGLEGLPPLFLWVECGVEKGEVGVQLRVKRAG